MQKKIILNKCFGGFDLSEEGYMLYAQKKGLELYKYKVNFKGRDCIYTYATEEDLFVSYFTKDFGNNVRISDEDYEKYHLYIREEYREDETLVQVVEELGESASGRFGNLQVKEIPENSFFEIDNYDGQETIYYSETEIFIQ